MRPPKVAEDVSLKEAFARKYPKEKEHCDKFNIVALACQDRRYEHLFLSFMLAVAGFTTARKIRSVDRPCKTLAMVEDYAYITIDRLGQLGYDPVYEGSSVMLMKNFQQGYDGVK